MTARLVGASPVIEAYYMYAAMRESWLTRPAAPRLHYAAFFPEGPVKAAVLIVPGFSEHVGRFRETAETWARLGFLVGVFDPRGQGRSEGVRGHVDRFDDHVTDTRAVLDALGDLPAWQSAGAPILFGHSLGALIAFQVALEAAPRLRALALSSPYFGMALSVPRWKLVLARLVSGFWPTYRDRTGLRSTELTHDLEQQRLIDEDPLNVSSVTARWFTEVERIQATLPNRAPELRLPVFCAAAGDDRVASLEQTSAVFEAMGSRDKSLQIYPEAYHELHHEVNRHRYLGDFARQFAVWVGGSLGD